MKNFFWLTRKKASLCILAGICSISLFVIINSGEKVKENSGGSYVVKIKHYGIDAAEMERSVTIPLEDALFAIAGVMSVQSSSENSHSKVFIRFKPGGRGRYEAVRDAAQRVYESLPSSAQRPEILSSNNSRVPVWSAAVLSANDVKENILAAMMLEKIVKPRLESLEGAGEVLVSGIGLREIVIVLDQEKLSLLGLEPIDVAGFLGMNDAVFSGGTIVRQNKEITIAVDGRYSFMDNGSGDMPPLEKALIPLGNGKMIELSQIALITEQERMPDVLSRLNGKRTAGISIMGRHGADLRKLSKDIEKELAALSLPLEFTVLSDLGAEEAAAFRSVFNAALLGAIMVAIISFLLNNRNTANSSGFFGALAIPAICLVSAAILSICGLPLNRLALAGIAAGVGTAVDAVILCSEKLRFVQRSFPRNMQRSFPRRCASYGEAAAALSELAGPLIAGAATTVAALLPLSFKGGEAGIIANAVAVVTLTALVISLTLLPPLLLWGMNSSPPKIAHRGLQSPLPLKRQLRSLSRLLCRFLAVDIRVCLRYPVLVISIGGMLTAAAVFALFVKGADTGSYGSEDSVYGQIEFDGGLLAEETDRLLAAYSETLASCKGIKNVETGARTGSGSLLVSFDPKLTQAHLVRDMAKRIRIPGGFLFFHENSGRDRYWEIRIYGDEDQKCRELAEELAYSCVRHPLIRERVLNFKQGSKKLVLLPDRERIAETGAGFSNAAARTRFGVYGPVAYKRVNSPGATSGEIDVRIMQRSFPHIETNNGNNLTDNVMRQSREGVLGILVSGVRIDSLMNSREEIEPASIRRMDRRRTASITITTGPKDPRRVKHELEPVFKKLDLPPGYSIEFDPEAIRQAQALSTTVLSLLLAVIFCYMVIASINESFTIPLLVLSAIPPSLAIPALILALSGSAYNSAVACAFIAVSGMTVNAAVLCVDGLRLIMQTHNINSLGFYLALRKKLPALLATTGTTVAAAMPFLFLREGANALIRTLSLVGALGVACSCLCSITVIPSLLFIFKKPSTQIIDSACAGCIS